MTIQLRTRYGVAPYENKTAYEIFGLNTDADEKTIKRTYKTLARKYHPDLNPNNKDSEERFKAVGWAMDCLSKYKEKYDKLLLQELTISKQHTTFQQPQYNTYYPSKTSVNSSLYYQFQYLKYKLEDFLKFLDYDNRYNSQFIKKLYERLKKLIYNLPETEIKNKNDLNLWYKNILEEIKKIYVELAIEYFKTKGINADIEILRKLDYSLSFEDFLNHIDSIASKTINNFYNGNRVYLDKEEKCFALLQTMGNNCRVLKVNGGVLKSDNTYENFDIPECFIELDNLIAFSHTRFSGKFDKKSKYVILYVIGPPICGIIVLSTSDGNISFIKDNNYDYLAWVDHTEKLMPITEPSKEIKSLEDIRNFKNLILKRVVAIINSKQKH